MDVRKNFSFIFFLLKGTGTVCQKKILNAPSRLGGIQGQAGWVPGQPDLVVDSPAHGCGWEQGDV